MEENSKKGTTTLGIVCKDAVVLAADKRASLGYLVANKAVDKIFDITDKIALTMAGVAADGQVLAKLLRAEMNLYKLNTNIEPNLKIAANLMSNVVFSQGKSFRPYIVQLILGGMESENKFALYTLDMLGSNIKERNYSSSGSGSPIAFGVLENGYVDDMTEEQGIQLAIGAMNAALKRDLATGDGIDIVVINKRGLKRIGKEKTNAMLKQKKK
jgi:proteasome beta subunit